MIAAEVLDEIRQQLVSDARDVRGRKGGFAAEAPIFLDQRNVVAGTLEQIGGGDAGNAGADDSTSTAMSSFNAENLGAGVVSIQYELVSM